MSEPPPATTTADDHGAVEPAGPHNADEVEKPSVAPTQRAAGPLIPSVASDDLDVGWGEEANGRDDQWYQRERPPHWS